MFKTIIPDKLYVFKGGVNTIILKDKNNAILFNCCDLLNYKELSAIGVDCVEKIYLTCHKRNHSSGIYNFNAPVIVSENEAYLIDDVDTYFGDFKNRWHIYHHQPSTMILPIPYKNVISTKQGDTYGFGDYEVQVIETPSTTDNALSYKIKIDDTVYCFCGEMLLKDGKLNELYSLQKGFGTMDYHGFMGNIRVLIPSLEKIKDADVAIASYGDLITDVASDAKLLKDKLLLLYKSYIKSSAINYFFPEVFDGYKDETITPAIIHEIPDFIKMLDGPAFSISSENNDVFLVDCGMPETVQLLKDEYSNKNIKYCFISHYHDDHTDSLQSLINEFGTELITHYLVADVVENPSCYFLPCIPHVGAQVKHKVQDGYSWTWNEFTFTIYHFPGQTLYHAGLLMQGRGYKIFFVGDSFTPTGMDYYCAPNRNFIKKGKGTYRCIDILKETQPDFIINNHIDIGFSFRENGFTEIEGSLAETKILLKEVLADENINFGLDEWWARVYPYEQNIMSGSKVPIEMRFTNHSNDFIDIKVMPVLPDGFSIDTDKSQLEVTLNKNTLGECLDEFNNSDGFTKAWINTPENKTGKFIIPFKVYKNNKYLGQIRHGIINLK